MLVNIYGSKELFVNEYRTLLSNRLLSQFTYDTEREIRNLELLKLRFGEASLHQVEVMLKDISDSKRINALLQNEATENTATAIKFKEWPVNAIIVSAQFWPQFKSETLELPEDFNKGLEAFTKSFETVKGNRTLVWKNHLGSANIDLEIGGKKINLNVPPMQAAIIFQFQIKSEWSAEELSKSLKVPLTTLRRKMAFWQGQGLLQETSPDQFKLIEEGPMRRMSGVASNNEAEMDDEAESVTRTSSDQRAEELKVFWSYIYNMLVNLESLPLDRIFQMLKMFAVQGPSAVEIDIEELRSFWMKECDNMNFYSPVDNTDYQKLKSSGQRAISSSLKFKAILVIASIIVIKLSYVFYKPPNMCLVFRLLNLCCRRKLLICCCFKLCSAGSDLLKFILAR